MIRCPICGEALVHHHEAWEWTINYNKENTIMTRVGLMDWWCFELFEAVADEQLFRAKLVRASGRSSPGYLGPSARDIANAIEGRR